VRHAGRQALLGSPSGKAITHASAPVHLIPITPCTRHWFDHSVRTTSCSAIGHPASPENAAAPRTPTDCAREALTRLQREKRWAPSFRTTRANPTGHFWFIKIPAGRYYTVSLIEEGSGNHQDERLGGPGLAAYRSRPRRKTHKSRSDRLQRQPVLSLYTPHSHFQPDSLVNLYCAPASSTF
jgi:hypothetical protein